MYRMGRRGGGGEIEIYELSHNWSHSSQGNVINGVGTVAECLPSSKASLGWIWYLNTCRSWSHMTLRNLDKELQLLQLDIVCLKSRFFKIRLVRNLLYTCRFNSFISTVVITDIIHPSHFNTTLQLLRNTLKPAIHGVYIEINY